MDFVARFVGSAVILGTVVGALYLASKKLAEGEQPVPLDVLKDAYIATVMSPFLVPKLLHSTKSFDVRVTCTHN